MENVKNGYDYIIYTDGGCAENPGGPGGYAAVILEQETGKQWEISGGFRSTTNNRMEIMAVIAAVERLPDGASFYLYSDSEYMLKCFTGIWQRKKNTDLFDRLDRAVAGKRFAAEWVRGHNGNRYNELCDSMCTEAMARPDLPEDLGYSELRPANPVIQPSETPAELRRSFSEQELHEWFRLMKEKYRNSPAYWNLASVQEMMLTSDSLDRISCVLNDKIK